MSRGTVGQAKVRGRLGEMNAQGCGGRMVQETYPQSCTTSIQLRKGKLRLRKERDTEYFAPEMTLVVRLYNMTPRHRTTLLNHRPPKLLTYPSLDYEEADHIRTIYLDLVEALEGAC